MDPIRLEYEIKKKGISLKELAETLGISKVALYRKINGKSDFKLCEMQKIAEIVGLETAIPIFFAKEVS